MGCLLISIQYGPVWAQADSAGIGQPLLPGVEDILVRGMEKGIKADYRGAIADFSQVIRLQPDLPDAYFNRGLAYQKMGDGQKAIADFNQTLKLDRNFADTYLARGRLYLSLQQLTLARQDFQSAATEFQRQGNDWGYQQAIEGLRSAYEP